VWDFSFSEEEMKKLKKLDQGSKARSFDMNFLKSNDDPTTLPEFNVIPRDTY